MAMTSKRQKTCDKEPLLGKHVMVDKQRCVMVKNVQVGSSKLERVFCGTAGPFHHQHFLDKLIAVGSKFHLLAG